MRNKLLTISRFLLVSSFLIMCVFQINVYCEELFTTDRVNFRVSPSLDADIMRVLPYGTSVTELERLGEWSSVDVGGTDGYIFNEFLGSKDMIVYPGSAQKVTAQETKIASRLIEGTDEIEYITVDLLDWSQARNIFLTGLDALITDVRTGIQYSVRSFSNGVHADVEPVSEDDTNLMRSTYGGNWDWEPRPIWVTVNGMTLAASINGMPHAGVTNTGNGVNGHFCVHFRGSVTNNGNKSHERDHQNAITEAFKFAD